MSMFPGAFFIVPLLMGLGALWKLATGIRDLVRARQLSSSGLSAEGQVVASFVEIPESSGDSRSSSRIVETIEFTTSSGEQIQGVPLLADVGMLDRKGQQVTVRYLRHRPDRFVAPRNGRSVSLIGPISKIAFSLVLIGAIALFVVTLTNFFGG